MIVALDPSTTKTGAALFSDDGTFKSACVLLPDNSGRDAIERSHQMARELLTFIDEVEAEFNPIRIAVIEEPYINQKAPRSAIGVQFLMLGMVYHVLRDAKVPTIELVNPSTWTRGKSKEARALTIRRVHGIGTGQDSGNDAVDAIGLGRWWINQNRHRLVKAAPTAVTSYPGNGKG